MMNPKTIGLEKPITRSPRVSALMAGGQNSSALMLRILLATRNPPTKPEASPIATSRGRINTVASTRGVTSLRIGSMPSPRMASTCSVPSMEPNSQAMPVALRPATSTETSKLRAGIQDDHAANADQRDHDDRQRTHANLVHLIHHVGPVRRGFKV